MKLGTELLALYKGGEFEIHNPLLETIFRGMTETIGIWPDNALLIRPVKVFEGAWPPPGSKWKEFTPPNKVYSVEIKEPTEQIEFLDPPEIHLRRLRIKCVFASEYIILHHRDGEKMVSHLIVEKKN